MHVVEWALGRGLVHGREGVGTSRVGEAKERSLVFVARRWEGIYLSLPSQPRHALMPATAQGHRGERVLGLA